MNRILFAMTPALFALTFLSLTLFASSTFAQSSVSLAQDTRDIVCDVKDGSRVLSGITIDKKDYALTVKSKDGKTVEYKQARYLDRGLLMVNAADPADHLFVLLLPGGEGALVQGSRIPFREADCADTGASKTCKNEKITELYWTPEKIRAKAEKLTVTADISRYGYFPSRGTYSLAREKSRGRTGYPAAVLLDFGAEVELLLGTYSKLHCHY